MYTHSYVVVNSCQWFCGTEYDCLQDIHCFCRKPVIDSSNVEVVHLMLLKTFVHVSMVKCLTNNTCARIIHCFVKCVCCAWKFPCFGHTYKGTTHCLPTYVCDRYALLQFVLLSALSGDTHPHVCVHVHMSLWWSVHHSCVCMYARTYPCVHICVCSETTNPL